MSTAAAAIRTVLSRFDHRCGADEQFTAVKVILSLRSAIASKGATTVLYDCFGLRFCPSHGAVTTKVKDTNHSDVLLSTLRTE